MFFSLIVTSITINCAQLVELYFGRGGITNMSGTYVDLEVWRASMELVVRIYRLSRQFPKEEIYGLTSQL